MRIESTIWPPNNTRSQLEVTYVFSCFNQDQPLDCVDFHALSDRLRQNSLQEKLTAQWIAHCLAAPQRDDRSSLRQGTFLRARPAASR